MTTFSKFRPYSESNPSAKEKIQPTLALRSWDDLTLSDKKMALQILKNAQWLDYRQKTKILKTIERLTNEWPTRTSDLELPFVTKEPNYRRNEDDRQEAAERDFENVFLKKNASLVFEMLSYFLEEQINKYALAESNQTEDDTKKDHFIESAYEDFEPLKNCLNRIFSKFFINEKLTRSGFIPIQDERIATEIYEPTLRCLSDPKWKSVNDQLIGAFNNFRKSEYPTCMSHITTGLHDFLSVFNGIEDNNSKGAFGKLMKMLKEKVQPDPQMEAIINQIGSLIPQKRSSESISKPLIIEPTPANTLLIMNIVIIFIQYCLHFKK